MAAAGSAVGLGNIWGFPTQAASNGGAAFLLVYLVLAFFLAYPALMAELILGRHAHANAPRALASLSARPLLQRAGRLSGILGLLVASFILSFYAIVAGWMIAFGLGSVSQLLGFNGVSQWFNEFSFARNLVFMLVFMVLTIAIISGGVREGIERWSERLMPALLLTLVLLVIYVLTLDGAMEGLKVYLMPDFSRAISPGLVISALGAAFFSLSLGVGTMLIYGSYLPDGENLPLVGGMVTLVDIFIAVCAGFLIIPAMYVAMHNGVEIFSPSGALLSEDTLIFTVLPELFATMGLPGIIVSIVFFFLMTIAALTSSISMLETPVAYAIEEHGMQRHRAVWLIGAMIVLLSTLILLDFGTLFGLVVSVTTRYAQPLLGIVLCLYAGWVLHRDALLKELQQGNPDAANSWFWRIWPWYVRLVCPAVILAIFVRSVLG